MKSILYFCLIVVLASCSEELPTEGQEALQALSSNSEAMTPMSKADSYPEVISLPTGFQPEGIAIGRGHYFFVGSLISGAIYRGDLRTGAGDVLVPQQEGRVAVGLAVDSRSDFLFVAGGFFGNARVYSASSGEEIATYQLTTAFGQTLVNDVVVTEDAAFFTDSFRPYLYRVPLGPAGRLPDAGQVEEIALTGDFLPGPGAPLGVDANGIVAAPDGKTLVVVHLDRGNLYNVDPNSGEAKLIDLGGASVPYGDGLVLSGNTLYVVQNLLNQIAVVELSPDYLSGSVLNVITSPNFRIPATAASFGDWLYAVNARFDLAPPGTPLPDADFEVVRVEK